MVARGEKPAPLHPLTPTSCSPSCLLTPSSTSLLCSPGSPPIVGSQRDEQDSSGLGKGEANAKDGGAGLARRRWRRWRRMGNGGGEEGQGWEPAEERGDEETRGRYFLGLASSLA